MATSIAVTAQNNKIDTCITCLPTWQVKLAIKDLQAYDACKYETLVLNDQLVRMNTQLEIKDTLLNVKEKQISVLRRNEADYKSTQETQEQRINELSSMVRKEKVKSIALGTTGLVVIVSIAAVLTYIMIK